VLVISAVFGAPADVPAVAARTAFGDFTVFAAFGDFVVLAAFGAFAAFAVFTALTPP
jgi:hypothetical protein